MLQSWLSKVHEQSTSRDISRNAVDHFKWCRLVSESIFVNRQGKKPVNSVQRCGEYCVYSWSSTELAKPTSCSRVRWALRGLRSLNLVGVPTSVGEKQAKYGTTHGLSWGDHIAEICRKIIIVFTVSLFCKSFFQRKCVLKYHTHE